MAAPITTQAGWYRLAVEQLAAEGRVHRTDRQITYPDGTTAGVHEMLLARVAALKAREAQYPAAYDAMVRRQAEERTTLDAQIAEALSALKIRHGSERRAFATNRHNVTPEE